MKHSTLNPSKGRPLRRLIVTMLRYGGMFLLIYLLVNWWRQPAMPDVVATTLFAQLQDVQGNAVTLPHDEAVLVYFWGSWCHVCTYSSPKVNALAKTAPVITVAVSSGDDQTLRHYMQQQDYHFTTINDDGAQIFHSWQGQVTPSYAIIKQGRMLQGFAGMQPLWVLKARLMLANAWQ